jgi:hypothetical protein
MKNDVCNLHVHDLDLKCSNNLKGKKDKQKLKERERSGGRPLHEGF